MQNKGGIRIRLIDALYTEAMLLADEARSYFDDFGRREREALSPLDRVAFTCESLKVRTRLMHVVAWLLTQRAVEAGEISLRHTRSRECRLGRVDPSDPLAAELPDTARTMIRASQDLYERIGRLDHGLDHMDHPASPARNLMQRLESSF